MSEHVEIVAFDHDNETQRVVALVTLVDGRAEVEVLDEMFDAGVPDVIQDPSSGEWASREDGTTFLDLLAYRFSGSYLAATAPHACGAADCAREVATA